MLLNSCGYFNITKQVLLFNLHDVMKSKLALDVMKSKFSLNAQMQKYMFQNKYLSHLAKFWTCCLYVRSDAKVILHNC